MISSASALLGKMGAFLGWGGAGQAYEAGTRHMPENSSWAPSINSGDDEVLVHRDEIVARARDLIRNNGFISGGMDRRVEAVIGSKIRLKCQPAYAAMGRDTDWSFNWSQTVQQAWSVYTMDFARFCDAEQIKTFGMIVNTAYRHYFIDGEALALVEDIERGGKYSTTLRLIDSDRLSNPNGLPDHHILANGNRLVGGVELDRYNAPVAYHIRVTHPHDPAPTVDKFRWDRIPRFGATGRPRVIHTYHAKRAEVRRGISQLAEIIIASKQMDRMDKATVSAALLQTIMALFITSPAPTEEVAEAVAPIETGASAGYLDNLLSFREKNKVRIGSEVQGIHGFPGEKFEFKAPTHPHNNFEAFMAQMLRKIASTFGLSYPQLSQDWAGINYSSARTLLNEIWRGLLDDRHVFTQMFCTPFYAAWLEEAIVLRKTITLPGGPMSFYRWRAELTMCDWMGPGRGTVDPKKEQEAASLAIAGNRSSDAREAEAQGLDFYTVYEELAYEKRLRERLGISDADNAVPTGPGRPADDSNDEADAREMEGADQ